ncbi:MAG: Hpt domain-containing protein [bacterium]
MDTDFRRQAQQDMAKQLDASLLPIRQAFLSTLIQRVIRFEALKQDLEAGQDMATALSGVANLAHKMAGVAETLGFGEIGIFAAEVDRAITGGRIAGQGDTDIWHGIEDTLEQLLDAMEAQLDD